MPTSPLAHFLSNRLSAVMAHTSRYGFRGPSRLAADLGVPRSTVVRLLAARSHPSAGMMLAILQSLEEAVGRPLDVRELFSFDGTYPTPSVCDLVGCAGCLPDEAYAADDTVKPQYRHLRRGEWPETRAPGSTTLPEPILPPRIDDTS